MKTKLNRFTALAAAVMIAAGMVSCGASDQSITADKGITNGTKGTHSVSKNTVNDKTAENRDGGDAQFEQKNDTADNTGETATAEMLSPEAMPSDDFTAEEYRQLEENGWTFVKDEPLSTFSTDVDTASYANARRMLTENMRVTPEAVRAEEFINYFRYSYNEPDADHPIALTTELSDCPWNKDSKLMLVGVQAEREDYDDRPPMNIVLLIDVSGSMRSEDKLPLAKKAFEQLAENLTSNDRISIVTYSGEERTVLSGATGDDYDMIIASIESLEAGGATAGEAGINMAYSLAEDYFIPGGNNRIVMATDGDLNVGISSAEELKELVEKKRESGVFLSVMGFGTGNLKDDRLETLADNGNGNYSYIDCEREARKVLLEEFGATLYTVAKDVKAQIEFNPANVAAYRLVGYENRMLAAEDFTDDKKDAGDMGSGHSSTALYEIIPAKGVLGSEGTGSIELKYQPEESKPEQQAVLTDELLTVKLRYKLPSGDESTEISAPVMVEDYTDKASANLRFASCAAEFAMMLRGSEYSGLKAEDILGQLTDDLLTDEYRQEFKELVTKAAELYR